MNFINSRQNLELTGEEYIDKDRGMSGTNEIQARSDLSRLFEDIGSRFIEPPFYVVIVYSLNSLLEKRNIIKSRTQSEVNNRSVTRMK